MSTPETDSLIRGDANPWNVFLDMAKLLDLCHKMERERDEWKEKAERLQRSKSDTLLTNCPDCKKFRGHGHECKCEQDTPITKP